MTWWSDFKAKSVEGRCFVWQDEAVHSSRQILSKADGLPVVTYIWVMNSITWTSNKPWSDSVSVCILYQAVVLWHCYPAHSLLVTLKAHADDCSLFLIFLPQHRVHINQRSCLNEPLILLQLKPLLSQKHCNKLPDWHSPMTAERLNATAPRSLQNLQLNLTDQPVNVLSVLYESHVVALTLPHWKRSRVIHHPSRNKNSILGSNKMEINNRGKRPDTYIEPTQAPKLFHGL